MNIRNIGTFAVNVLSDPNLKSFESFVLLFFCSNFLFFKYAMIMFKATLILGYKSHDL